jgi:hypothetical protein
VLALVVVVAGRPNLQHIDLHFSKDRVSDRGLCTFSSCLLVWSSLRAAQICSTLTFQTSRAGSATEGFPGIQLVLACLVVVAGCPNLQHIDLSDFAGRVSDRGSPSRHFRFLVCACVADYPNLQHIDLSDLRTCQRRRPPSRQF